ncbi:MAG: ABC transporter permease subunit [Ilumatobacter sp.]
MIRPELFKLRHHLTPWALLATLTAAVIIAPVYYAIRNPVDVTAVTEILTNLITALGALLAAVFGGWVVGHEFRQGTLRRVLGSDARRGRLLATKAAIGTVALAAGLSIAAGVGALASMASAATFGESLVWDGVLRELLAAGFISFVVAAIAFGLSVLLRSDTYAMLGSLALMIIVGPLLSLIPWVGKYMPSQLTNDVMSWISGFGDEATVSIAPASLILTATLAALAGAAAATFQHRDV